MAKVGVQKEIKLFEVRTSKNFQLLRHGFQNIFLVIYISPSYKLYHHTREKKEEDKG